MHNSVHFKFIGNVHCYTLSMLLCIPTCLSHSWTVP